MKDNFAQQVKFQIKEKQMATMIVNGVAQESRTIQYVSMKCPSCEQEIMAFQDGLPLVEIYKELAQQGSLKDFPSYCHHCGAKIMCDKSVVDTQTCETL